MAQVFVSKINEWYQALAGLKNYKEKDLEASVLKYAESIFTDYYAFQSGFTFANKNNPKETSDPDILLISKNFREWIILEMELLGKGLTHTRKQLRVFTAPDFDVNELVRHCLTKETALASDKQKLEQLLQTIPKVIVLFDSYDRPTFNAIETEFSVVKIGVFEVYVTNGHLLEVYRFSGEYPYIKSDHSLCKYRDFFRYEIKRPEMIVNLKERPLELIYNNTTYKALLKVSDTVEERNGTCTSHITIFL